MTPDAAVYPDTATQRLLASLGACPEARTWVGARSLTDCWARAHSQRALDWGRWLVRALAGAEYERACAPARAEYERVRALAWSEYERACAPALAEYERARAPARAEYDRALAWAAYDRACAPALAEYDRASAPALAEYDRACALALAEYDRVRALADACTTCAELRAAFPCPAVPSWGVAPTRVS